MVRITNIHPLTVFQRNARAHVTELKKSGEPAVLTVNGKPEVVVQDAEAYQQLLDLIDMHESAAVLNERSTSFSRASARPLRKLAVEKRAHFASPTRRGA